MIGGLFLLNKIMPVDNPSRIMSIVICGVYACVGALIYFGMSTLLKTFKNVDFISQIKNKFLKRGAHL